MDPDDLKRKYVRTPKPESKLGLSPLRSYYAYDPEGKYKGIVKLTIDNKERHERMGWTLKPRWT